MVGVETVKIHGLTVCVDYAEFLRVGLPRWLSGLESLTVVTAPRDIATIEACAEFGAEPFVTDLFYKDGAAFNKGRAMEAARVAAWGALAPSWRLFFDSDVVPPADWVDKLDRAHAEIGSLYGCLRYDAAADALEDVGQARCSFDVPGVGYFQLFHSADPVVQRSPLLTSWQHAGNYDNVFMDLWRARGIRVQCVPFRVAHIGERENWWGRGKRAEFEAMRRERVFRAGKWDHERIEPGGTADITPVSVDSAQSSTVYDAKGHA